MIGLKLSTEARDGLAVIRAEGEIDVYTAPMLREALAAAAGGSLVVDLARCELMDSTGLGVLVGALKVARASDHDVAIACAREKLLAIFRTTGLAKVFTIADSVDEAVAAVAGKAGGR